MFGRGSDNYDDYDLEQRMDEIEDRRSNSGPYDDLLVMLFGVAVGIGLVGGALGWLDHRFGWGLLPWFKDALGGIIG